MSKVQITLTSYEESYAKLLTEFEECDREKYGIPSTIEFDSHSRILL
jgi:hypothetical protein